MQGHEPDEIMQPILWTEWPTGALEGLATGKRGQGPGNESLVKS
jgi:hypothetical protein